MLKQASIYQEYQERVVGNVAKIMSETHLL
jgi:hypothetical protein